MDHQRKPFHSLHPRDVGNITGPTGFKNGLINASHASNLTASWTSSSLPSPFPLVVISALVSLVFACIGWKTAMSTWVPPERRRPTVKPEGFEHWTFHKRWVWARQHAAEVQRGARVRRELYHVPSQALEEMDRQLPKTKSNENYVPAPNEQKLLHLPSPISIWMESPLTKALVILSVIYNTLRSLFAIVTTLKIAVNHEGSHSAVSLLFLLFLSLQTFVSDRKLPRLLTLILVLDLFLVGIAFLAASWDFRSHRYGDAVIIGGNCPIYASDCTSQARQWTRVGCGSVLPPISATSNSQGPNPNRLLHFYPPYATAGDINSDGNKLRVLEAVVAGGGSIWAGVTLLVTLYETVRMFLTAESMRHMLWPIPIEDHFVTNQKTGKTRRRVGWGAIMIFAFQALAGAFLVTILSIAGHIAGETHAHTAVYMDSFGPAVDTNVTYITVGHSRKVNSTDYWGNATSWSDCFSVTAPGSRDGFFKDWFEHNQQAAFRLVSLL